MPSVQNGLIICKADLFHRIPTPIEKYLDAMMEIKTLEKAYPNYKKHIQAAFQAGQSHVFRWWDEISQQEKNHLLEQLASIHFPFIHKLFRDSQRKATHTGHKTLLPPQIITIPQNHVEWAAAQKAKLLGEDALRNGHVAVLTVAGGDGTRLGVSAPKGTLPITPITGKSIFQLYAENIRAVQQRYRTRLPWYIMTSETNNLATREFFQINRFFGLEPEQVFFFAQGMLPVVDFQGNLLMDSKSNILTSPNGHGGAILALKERGILDDMKGRGIEQIFYHQVDNVLIKIADPVFLGYHVRDGAEMSLKIVKKQRPEEKVGVVGCVDGRLHIIEYSELSKEEMCEMNADGDLKYNAGNTAIHAMDINFLERVYHGENSLPYHVAEKRVPCLNERGVTVTPEKNNAIKFESFIFDVLKQAKRGVVMEVLREEEFSPIKNMEGENSPATARQDMINRYGRWLRDAGVSIPMDPQGNVIGLIEISPGFALDAEELKSKVDKRMQFQGKLSL